MHQMSSGTRSEWGACGIVVGDVFRRLIARTIAQEIGEIVQSANVPCQNALTTRAPSVCLTFSRPSLNPMPMPPSFLLMALVRSIWSRGDGLWWSCFAFRATVFGQPSLHIWEDEVGEGQDIPQGGGGDQGDPLMPLHFSLAMHPSLVSTGNLLREGEKLFVFLDDVYLICKPERVLVFRLIENALWIHARISVHCGKTQLWNRSGATPRMRGSHQSNRLARGPSFASFATGRRRVGSPLGHHEFIKAKLMSSDGTRRSWNAYLWCVTCSLFGSSCSLALPQGQLLDANGSARFDSALRKLGGGDCLPMVQKRHCKSGASFCKGSIVVARWPA